MFAHPRGSGIRGSPYGCPPGTGQVSRTRRRLALLGQGSGMTPELVSLLLVHGAGSRDLCRGCIELRASTVTPHGAQLHLSNAHGPGGRTCRLVSANLEHDLATLPAARDSLERRPGLRERKNRVDLRAKLACVHERSQLQQLLV